RSAAVKAFRKAHGIEPKPPREAGGPAPAAAAAAAGNGGGDGAAGAAGPPRGGAPPGGAARGRGGAARRAPPPPRRAPRPARAGAADKQRLLALVQPEGIQRVQREQGDRVNVWPHLLAEEFVAMFIVLAFVTIYSTFVDAPLRELANPNLTPNPSKAPWYFLG